MTDIAVRVIPRARRDEIAGERDKLVRVEGITAAELRALMATDS